MRTSTTDVKKEGKTRKLCSTSSMSTTLVFSCAIEDLKLNSLSGKQRLKKWQISNFKLNQLFFFTGVLQYKNILRKSTIKLKSR